MSNPYSLPNLKSLISSYFKDPAVSSTLKSLMGNISFENLVRVAMVLGRLKELEELFKPHLKSVDDILRYESNTARQRIKRK